MRGQSRIEGQGKKTLRDKKGKEKREQDKLLVAVDMEVERRNKELRAKNAIEIYGENHTKIGERRINEKKPTTSPLQIQREKNKEE